MEVLQELTLPGLLLYGERRFTDTPALSFVNGQPLTYHEVYREAHRVASYLISAGIKPGDTVALFSENMPHWGITYFGISLTGAVIVPILPDFHPAEVENILNHSGAETVFVSEKLYEKVQPLNSQGERTFICIDRFEFIPPETEKKDLKTKGVPFPAEDNVPFSPYAFKEDDTASIIYTAGTTGYSKGVMLSHKNIISNVVSSSTIPGIKQGDHLLSILPLSHSYECTIGFLVPFYNGATIFYIQKPPSASVLLPALKRVRPGVMLSVPLLIEKIVRQSILPTLEKNKILKFLYHFKLTHREIARLAGKKLMKTFGDKLYFFGIGGAALSEDVEVFLKEARFPYAIGYGLTETAPLIAGSNAAHTRLRSTGPVIPGGEIKIINTNPETGEGEILYRGPNVMQGYYKEPEKTAEVLDSDGWFHTGDLGIIDRDGYLFIKGRVKTMILGASGENIYPEAIEAIINKFDLVEDSIVFQDEGNIVALVNLEIESLLDGAHQASEAISSYTQDLIKMVNKQLNSFSRISKLRYEEKPFEKTPKKTIKRYLYTRFKKDDTQ